MTLDEFSRNWENYSVQIGEEKVALAERYAMSWGIPDSEDYLVLDTGDWDGEINFYRVRGEELYSVNPEKTSEEILIGKLVRNE